MRKNDKCSYHQNKKMNDSTYKLRQEVMSYIYEAKKISGGKLDRVMVRITDICDPLHSTVLASARTQGRVIWVTERAIEKRDLRTIVFHEILHACYGISHDENCPLMRSDYVSLNKQKATTLFKHYI